MNSVEYLGNYTMVMLDMIMLGRGIRREVYQIGAYSSLSDSFLRLVQSDIFIVVPDLY